MARTMRAMSNSTPSNAALARTAPTWEVELLISGVAVFAMMQLPGWLDSAIFAMEPRLDQGWRLIAVLAYFYAKCAAVILAVTFSLHLLMRAQWIALMGMHSVFPQGMRMDDTRMGPIQRGIEAEQPDDTAEAIERADNRASVTFAIGVTVALIMLAVCLGFCGTLLIANLLSRAFDLQIDTFFIVLWVALAFFGPMLLAVLIDQAFGHRLKSDGWPYRAVSATIRFYTRIGMGRKNNRVVAILLANKGERRAMLTVFGVMMLAVVGVFASFIGMNSRSQLGSYGLFPAADGIGIDAEHYDDERDPARDGASPYVQSMVIRGPYLQLVVPYNPRRNNAAMRGCDVAEDAPERQQAQTRLACLGKLHALQLDGKPVADPDYQIASDPRADRPALLAMIDIRDLPRGRHELVVARQPKEGSKRKKPDPAYDRIVFWN